MRIFISYNKHNTQKAKTLANALLRCNVDVWFDEWSIRPGESIIGGVQNGLSTCEVLVFLWSTHEALSKWVETELRSYLVRRINDSTLRIVPIMLDATPLPTMLAEYKGFKVSNDTPFDSIAEQIVGVVNDVEVASMLTRKLKKLTDKLKNDHLHEDGLFEYVVCPNCGNSDLKYQMTITDVQMVERYITSCSECGWLHNVRDDRPLDGERRRQVRKHMFGF